AKRRSGRDGIALGNLVLNGRLKIRKSDADDWLSHYRCIQSRMRFQCIEILLVKRFQKATDDRLVFFHRHWLVPPYVEQQSSYPSSPTISSPDKTGARSPLPLPPATRTRTRRTDSRGRSLTPEPTTRYAAVSV